jgi:GNAT superfamily N-acetyltransferase
VAFEIAFRQLSPELQPSLGRFSCGRDSLDEFLRDDALDFHRYGLTHTTLVFVQGDDEIAAYFSLSSDGIRLSPVETFELGLPFDAEIKYFPAVKITKFAVCRRYQRSGLGMQLIDAIEGLVYADGKAVATRILTVDAINEPDVVAFYGRAGFLDAQEAVRAAQGRQRETIAMYKDIFKEAAPA